MAEPQIAPDAQVTDDANAASDPVTNPITDATPSVDLDDNPDAPSAEVEAVSDTDAAQIADSLETESTEHATPETAPEASETSAPSQGSAEPHGDTQRPRKWHFQPEIHMTIAEQKLPMLLNTETGELEMPRPLRMDRDCLLRFLGGISDGELSSLEQSIQALGQFVTIDIFTLTALTVAPTGELSFNLAAHPEPQGDGPVPAMSFDNIRFTVSKDLQS